MMRSGSYFSELQQGVEAVFGGVASYPADFSSMDMLLRMLASSSTTRIRPLDRLFTINLLPSFKVVVIIVVCLRIRVCAIVHTVKNPYLMRAKATSLMRTPLAHRRQLHWSIGSIVQCAPEISVTPAR